MLPIWSCCFAVSPLFLCLCTWRAETKTDIETETETEAVKTEAETEAVSHCGARFDGWFTVALGPGWRTGYVWFVRCGRWRAETVAERLGASCLVVLLCLSSLCVSRV